MQIAILFALVPATWLLGPFDRPTNEAILKPDTGQVFDCPMRKETVKWEEDHVFNPAAVVRKGIVFLLYRAEDASGKGIGMHTSRIGLATSKDGIHFTKNPKPVLFPKADRQKTNEWTGGCEDPRVVETSDGRYVMTYTQWNRKVARLAVATSRDLVHWTKYGPAFKVSTWSKSGSIVCHRNGDHLIATKVRGKYWMYWGDTSVSIATSPDLVHWKTIPNVHPISPRPGKFDSTLTEPGPPAIITPNGVLLLYNGKNSGKGGDPDLPADTYAAGQALFDAKNPAKLLQRTDKPFLKPERDYEKTGQYTAGTVFIEGLAHFHGGWLLYYGTADSFIGVAATHDYRKLISMGWNQSVRSVHSPRTRFPSFITSIVRVLNGVSSGIDASNVKAAVFWDGSLGSNIMDADKVFPPGICTSTSTFNSITSGFILSQRIARAGNRSGMVFSTRRKCVGHCAASSTVVSPPVNIATGWGVDSPVAIACTSIE
jgi:predicted GH43/DUF377 family glycosyl hydrolase